MYALGLMNAVVLGGLLQLLGPLVGGPAETEEMNEVLLGEGDECWGEEHGFVVRVGYHEEDVVLLLDDLLPLDEVDYQESHDVEA
jgi:hypothetical protein